MSPSSTYLGAAMEDEGNNALDCSIMNAQEKVFAIPAVAALLCFSPVFRPRQIRNAGAHSNRTILHDDDKNPNRMEEREENERNIVSSIELCRGRFKPGLEENISLFLAQFPKC